MWSDLMLLICDINFQHSLHSRKVGYWIIQIPRLQVAGSILGAQKYRPKRGMHQIAGGLVEIPVTFWLGFILLKF